MELLNRFWKASQVKNALKLFGIFKQVKKFLPFSCTKGLTLSIPIVYNITVKEKKRIRLKQDHYGVFESDFSLRIKEFLVDKRLFSIPFIDSNLLDCLS